MIFRSQFSKPVYLIDGLRTPIGNPFKSLKTQLAPQLAASVIREIAVRNKIHKTFVDQVILGNVVSAGLGQNVARQAALEAGLADSVIAYTINNVCGSGMQAIALAKDAIIAGEADVVIAGGCESATHAPYIINRENAESQAKNESKDSQLLDGLFCQISKKRMGELAEELAKRNYISREEQDRYALESHRKAILAQEQGKLKNEIVGIKGHYKDDRPRQNITAQSLRGLRPAFEKDGTITAGNSSIPCDGAAVVLVASKEFVQRNKIMPLARLVGSAHVLQKPEMTFETAVPAIEECLRNSHLSLKNIDLFEVSEAFAAQMVYIKNKLKIPDEKLNVLGGDVAFGHPLGAVGSRIVVTLMHALQDRKAKRGLAAVCYGGGGAMALVFERV